MWDCSMGFSVFEADIRVSMLRRLDHHVLGQAVISEVWIDSWNRSSAPCGCNMKLTLFCCVAFFFLAELTTVSCCTHV